MSTLIRTNHEIMATVHGAGITETGTIENQEEESEDI